MIWGSDIDVKDLESQTSNMVFIPFNGTIYIQTYKHDN